MSFIAVLILLAHRGRGDYHFDRGRERKMGLGTLASVSVWRNKLARKRLPIAVSRRNIVHGIPVGIDGRV